MYINGEPQVLTVVPISSFFGSVVRPKSAHTSLNKFEGSVPRGNVAKKFST